MADSEKAPIIVVKKIKKSGHAHHGGAWKIAYADFVTAMMAFFLLMWLLGSVGKEDLKGIAEYFSNPISLSMSGSSVGSSNSVLDGGGPDLSRKQGQITHGSQRRGSQPNLEGDQKLDRADAERLNQLKAKIEGVIDRSEFMQQFQNQIKLDITQEGLRIQILDEQNRPMFDSGSAELKEHMKDILKSITKMLLEVGNKITLSGHTDANPYASGAFGYSNWELSADRANAVRRQMMLYSMPEDKVLRVVGLASSVPMIENDPYAAVNRRIAIVVMNVKTERAVIESAVGNQSSPIQLDQLGVQLPSLPSLEAVQ